MLADEQWLAYQKQHSIGNLAIFYASPHKQTAREHLDPLFCVRPGRTPRSIMAAGRIQRQLVLDQNLAWQRYGTALGADTEGEWQRQASAVLRNSRKTYGGRILAIELIDFRAFSPPVIPETVGLTDTEWSDKKNVGDEPTTRLLRLLELEPAAARSEPDENVQTQAAGAGFGDSAENRLVESAAISAVRSHYEADGWAVRSVERDRCGFDLECCRDTTVESVEVKGVRATEQAFIITSGEVHQARTNPGFVLIVVTAALSPSPVLTRYSGAEFCQRFSLSAIQYSAALRP